jgi:hypothetical protein
MVTLILCLHNKALAETVHREVPGPDPLGGGLRSTNEGVRDPGGLSGEHCAPRVDDLVAPQSVPRGTAGRTVLPKESSRTPDTLVSGPEASAERVSDGTGTLRRIGSVKALLWRLAGYRRYLVSNRSVERSVGRSVGRSV